MIANYLSRQLRTIIRHAVRGSGCAAFRDIARVRTKFSLGVYVHTRVYARACVLRCPQRGERETGVPDSVTPTVDALSPFFSPLPLPPPFVRLPRSLSLPFLSILRAKRASSPSLYLSFRLTPPLSPPSSLSIQRSRARITGSFAARLCSGRYHGSICSRALSRNATTLGSEGNCPSRMFDHREIRRNDGTTKRRGEGRWFR